MNKFVKEYFEKLDEASKIADKAKIYILDNWEKIKDYSLATDLVGLNEENTPNKLNNTETIVQPAVSAATKKVDTLDIGGTFESAPSSTATTNKLE